jgi:hypothetical protein
MTGRTVVHKETEFYKNSRYEMVERVFNKKSLSLLGAQSGGRMAYSARVGAPAPTPGNGQFAGLSVIFIAV